ncbi:hypothetical protein Micbo1qcDRAFT_174119 [Microdochium bolleyi]|uniref:Uncharacterized protein n=1 Tax=Microdochium bolleyi TaxID=196109 RepID=A0A136J770_9PEZI|nr:hypothetical protein Micbo1qcDRAFT_174119 [Microdochium bolleyi]
MASSRATSSLNSSDNNRILESKLFIDPHPNMRMTRKRAASVSQNSSFGQSDPEPRPTKRARRGISEPPSIPEVDSEPPSSSPLPPSAVKKVLAPPLHHDGLTLPSSQPDSSQKSDSDSSIIDEDILKTFATEEDLYASASVAAGSEKPKHHPKSMQDIATKLMLKYRKAKKRLARSRSAQDDLQATVIEKDEKINALETQLDQTQAALDDDLSSHEQELAKLKKKHATEVKKLKAKQKTTNEEKKQLTKELKEYEQNAGHLEEQIEDAAQEKNDLQEYVNKLREQVQKLQEKNEKLQDKNEKLQEKNEKLQEKNEKLQEKNESLPEQGRTMSKRIAKQAESLREKDLQEQIKDLEELCAKRLEQVNETAAKSRWLHFEVGAYYLPDMAMVDGWRKLHNTIRFLTDAMKDSKLCTADEALSRSPIYVDLARMQNAAWRTLFNHEHWVGLLSTAVVWRYLIDNVLDDPFGMWGKKKSELVRDFLKKADMSTDRKIKKAYHCRAMIGQLHIDNPALPMRSTLRGKMVKGLMDMLTPLVIEADRQFNQTVVESIVDQTIGFAKQMVQSTAHFEVVTAPVDRNMNELLKFDDAWMGKTWSNVINKEGVDLIMCPALIRIGGEYSDSWTRRDAIHRAVVMAEDWREIGEF